jgi:hypothetical protein
MKISHKRRLAFGLHWFAGFCARRTVPDRTSNRARCQVRMARLNTITGPVCVSEQRFEVSVLLCACSKPPASESRCDSVLVFATSSPGCFCGVAPIPISGNPFSIMAKPCRQCSSAPSVKSVGPSFWQKKCLRDLQFVRARAPPPKRLEPGPNRQSEKAFPEPGLGFDHAFRRLVRCD